MRDWAGINPTIEKDPQRRDKDAKIDYFLRDLSRALRRINDGLVPDGSGTPITDVNPSGLYWLLAGRPDNQLGYGGTSPRGTGTLSSTSDPTKGFFYLGEAKQTAYDETNERLGINESTPDAKLHINLGTQTQVARPTADVNTGGMGGDSGETSNLYLKVRDSNDSTYIKCNSATPGGPVFTLSSMSNPGVLTGFTINVTAYTTDSTPGSPAYDYINISMSDNTNTTLFNASGTSDPTRRLTNALTTYSLPVTFGVSPSSWADLRVSIGFSTGNPNDGEFRITEISFSIPGTSTDSLQKWESGSNSNLLDYALDANSATTLQLSGTPKLRIATSGLEFDIGTPAAGNIWSASDSEGTGAWVTLTSLLDQDLIDIAGITRNRGDLIYGGASAWVDLAISASAGSMLRSDGTDPTWSTTLWPNTATSGGVLYASAANTWATSGALTASALVLGGGAGGAPSSLALGSANRVLGMNSGGTAHEYKDVLGTANEINVSHSANTITIGIVDPLIASKGGTGFASYAVGDILYADTTTTLAKLADVATGNALISGGVGAAPAWGKIDLTSHVTGDLPFANLTQGSARSVLGVTGNATADVASIQGTASQVLVVNSAGTALAFGALDLAAAAAITGDLPFANLTQGSARSVLGVTGNSTADVASIQGTANQVLMVNSAGTALSFAALSTLTSASFLDSAFRVIGSSDATKLLAFEVDGFTTATTRTLTPQNASYTIAGTDFANTFTKHQIIQSDTDLSSLDVKAAVGLTDNLMIWSSSAGTGDIASMSSTGDFVVVGSITAPSIAIKNGGSDIGTFVKTAGSSRTYTFPDTTMTICGTGATQNISNKTMLVTSNTLRADTSSSGVAFVDNTTTTKALRFILSGAVGNNTITISSTAARNYTLPDKDTAFDHGTYTPTLTNVTNLAASTAYQCQYLRVGKVVTVSGKVDVDPTAAGATELGISLPIASNFGAQEDCGGVGFSPGIAGQGMGIRADATNDRAAMVWTAVDVTNQATFFTFSYEII